MKIGFTSETEEPLKSAFGTADVDEVIDDEDEIWIFFFPKILDFFMIYGAVSFVKDVIEYVKPKGGGK